MRKTFYLDKRNGKFMGVCAGIANYFGIDATFVRVGAVVVSLLGAAPWTFIAYALAAWFGKSSPQDRFGFDEAPARRVSTREVRDSIRDIDRRMADVETYVTSSNNSLAREIEQLR